MELNCRTLDYTDERDAGLLVELLDAYARDPMGGAEPLGDAARARLPGVLAATQGAFSLVAETEAHAVGLANCFTTVSTFAARPLINVHDVFVRPEARGTGVVDALFSRIEVHALKIGACKITLEVLEGNLRAQSVYKRLGFSGYALGESSGFALFWERRLA